MKTTKASRSRQSARILAGSIAALLAVQSAQATVLYWDTNGVSTASFSANGNWDGVATNWNTDPLGGGAGVLGAATTAADDLHLSAPNSTGGTITLTGTQLARSITFDLGLAAPSSATTLSGGTINLGGAGTSGIFVSAAPAVSTAYTNTISSPITLVSNATIRQSSVNQSLYFSSTGTISGTANLELQNNSFNQRGLRVEGNVSVVGTITNNGTGRGIVSQTAGVISGAGTNIVQDSATSTLLLLGTNTYTGTTTLRQGILSVGAAAALGAPTTPAGSIIFDGGILQIYNNFTPTDLSARFTTTNSNDYKIDTNTKSVTYATNLAQVGAQTSGLRKYGTGTLTLSTANTYVGTTTIGGIDSAGNQMADGGTLQVTGSLNGTIGTALDFRGSGVFEVKEAAASTQGMGATTFTAGHGTVQSTFALTSANLTLASVARSVSGTGNFALSGGTPGTSAANANGTPGTNNIIITGQATGAMGGGYYFGGTNYAYYDGAGFVRALNYIDDVIPAGAATQAVSTTSLTSATNQEVQAGAAISAQASAAFTTLKISNTANANQAFTLASGATVTANSLLVTGGSGSLSKVTISGGTAFSPTNNSELIIRTDGSNDRLVVSNFLGDGTNALTKSGAGTLVLSGANTIGGSGITGNVAVNQGVLLINSSANTTYSGQISGAGRLDVTGPGKVTLNGAAAHTFTGGMVINGTLELDYSNMATAANYVAPGIPGVGGTGAPAFVALGGGAGTEVRGVKQNSTLLIKAKSTGTTYQNFGALNVNGSSSANVTVQNGTGSILVDPNGGDGVTIHLGVPATLTSNVLIGKSAGAGSGTVTFQSYRAVNSVGNGQDWGHALFTTDGGTTVDFTNANEFGGNGLWNFNPLGTASNPYSAWTTGGAGGYAKVTGATIAGLGGTMTMTGGVGTSGAKIEDPVGGQSIVLTGATINFGIAGLLMTGTNSGNFTVSGSNWTTANTGRSNALSINQYAANMSLTLETVIFNNDNGASTFDVNGPGTVIFKGLNTFGQIAKLNGGIVEVGVLGTPGTNGPLGRLTSAGSILFSGSTLRYSAANQLDYSGRFSTSGNEPIKIDTNGQNVTFATALAGAATELTKLGAGTLTLTGNTNTYTGKTTVNGGTLGLGYGVQNNTKLSDTAALVLGGGTVDLNGGSHLEVVASTTLNGGMSGVTQTGGTAVLRMNAITRNTGAFVNLGADNIASTSTANTAGILGAWATVGGTTWATNSGTDDGGAVGNSLITGLTTFAEVDARAGGPGASVITDGSTTNVRILGDGTAGNIGLNSATVTVNTLLQGNVTPTASTLGMAGGDTLRVNGIMIGSGKGALTIGDTAGLGTLTTATAGGELALINNDAGQTFLVNAVIANNTSASSLTKTGIGNVQLGAANTFSGNTVVSGGSLTLHNALALQNSTLDYNTYGGSLSFGTLTAATLGGLQGSQALALTNTTPANVALTVGNNGTSTTYSGIMSGGGSLTKTGTGTLALTNANTHTGTTLLSTGTLALGNVNAVQNSTLDTGPAGAQTVTFTVGGTNTYNLGGLSGADDINAGANSLNVGANSTNATFTGNGIGAAFTKVGTAVQDLNGASQNYGTLAVNDGTLNINGTLGTGTSVVTVTDTVGGAATKLRFGSVSQTLSSLTIGAGATVVFTSGVASGSFSGGGDGKAPGFSAGAVVPEPGTIGLLLVGALSMLGRRRRA